VNDAALEMFIRRNGGPREIRQSPLPALYETYANTAPFIDIRYQRNVSASAFGEYFGGKLTTMAGVTMVDGKT